MRRAYLFGSLGGLTALALALFFGMRVACTPTSLPTPIQSKQNISLQHPTPSLTATKAPTLQSSYTDEELQRKMLTYNDFPKTLTDRLSGYKIDSEVECVPGDYGFFLFPYKGAERICRENTIVRRHLPNLPGSNEQINVFVGAYKSVETAKESWNETGQIPEGAGRYLIPTSDFGELSIVGNQPRTIDSTMMDSYLGTFLVGNIIYEIFIDQYPSSPFLDRKIFLDILREQYSKATR